MDPEDQTHKVMQNIAQLIEEAGGEMKHLVNKLFQSNNPYFCPHGRPIIVNLSTEDLDKRFERY